MARLAVADAGGEDFMEITELDKKIVRAMQEETNWLR